MNDDLYTGRYDDNGYNDESDSHSEDSNSEGHWGNEYPDEEEDDNDSIGEREMRRAVKNFDIGMAVAYYFVAECFFFLSCKKLFYLDDDLSDDGSDDDVNRYGTAYAKYKKRVLKQNDYYDGVIDEDGDYISDLSESSD